MIQSQSFFLLARFPARFPPLRLLLSSSHFLLFPPSCSTQSLYLLTDGGGGGREEKGGGELCQYLHCSTYIGGVCSVYFSRRDTFKTAEGKGERVCFGSPNRGRGNPPILRRNAMQKGGGERRKRKTIMLPNGIYKD